MLTKEAVVEVMLRSNHLVQMANIGWQLGRVGVMNCIHSKHEVDGTHH